MLKRSELMTTMVALLAVLVPCVFIAYVNI